MTTIPPEALIGAITVSFLATGVWLALFFRILYALAGDEQESRRTIVVMPLVGLIAAIGTLASASAQADFAGIITLDIPAATLTFVASMGRGALLMGGIIVLAMYRPMRKDGPVSPHR